MCMSVRRRIGWCCALALLASGAACHAAAVSEQISLEMSRRAEALSQRLSDGRLVHVVVFGDSISDGWGTDGTHVYHRMVLDCLRYRFPEADIATTVVATPGQTTGEALAIVDARVISRRPDMIIVQFGGNDKGWGRPLSDFRRDYAMLLSRLSESTHAVVIACLPPIAEVKGDNEWSQAARYVATREGVPWADFHRAIGEGPGDFRGSFPHESHPGSFTHVIMAKALLAAFDRALDVEPAFECRLLRGTRLSAEGTHLVRAEIISHLDRTCEWEARLEFGTQSADLHGSVVPRGRSVIDHTFEIPNVLPAGHAFATPVRLNVRGAGYGSFDTAWLVMAPAIGAPDLAEGVVYSPTWHRLGANALTIGRHLWQGEDDLSARFAVTTWSDHLRIEVQVTDDDVTVADLTDPSRGDSVELYLDLRDERAQGRPVYERDVLALQIIPPTQAPVQWRNMHPLPADLRDLSVLAALSERGYRVRVELPLTAIQARRGQGWGGIGCDVGINDADCGGWRRCQMMWSGTGDNYINPAFLAGVWPGEIPTGATRRALQ